jgi:hypothetical protein
MNDAVDIALSQEDAVDLGGNDPRVAEIIRV